MKVKENAILACLLNPVFHQRIVPAKKGKGSYKRSRNTNEDKL